DVRQKLSELRLVAGPVFPPERRYAQIGVHLFGREMHAGVVGQPPVACFGLSADGIAPLLLAGRETDVAVSGAGQFLPFHTRSPCGRLSGYNYIIPTQK